MLELQILIIAFVSSFLGLIVPWSSSALSVSSMILLGIPVQLAKIIYQIWNLWINIGALIPLLKTQKLRMDLVIPLGTIALVSGFLWGKILIIIPTDILLRLTGAFMISLLLINLFSKSIWIKSSHVSKKIKNIWFLAYFFLNLFYSLFPMGMGILYRFLHTFFFRVTNLEAQLMGCVLTIPFVLGFMIPVISWWFYNISHIVFFTIGWYFWWYIWAHTAIRLGNFWLKKILMTWLFFLGIYFLFFA